MESEEGLGPSQSLGLSHCSPLGTSGQPWAHEERGLKSTDMLGRVPPGCALFWLHARGSFSP